MTQEEDSELQVELGVEMPGPRSASGIYATMKTMAAGDTVRVRGSFSNVYTYAKTFGWGKGQCKTTLRDGWVYIHRKASDE